MFSKRIAAILLLVVALGPLATAAAGFTISFWVDPLVAPEAFDGEYARIAAANFTTVLGGFGALTNASIQAQIAACAKHGLTLLPTLLKNVPAAEQPTAPNVVGYQVQDEPSVPAFAGLANVSATLRAAHPDTIPFINLLPNYASPGALGAPTYDAYVKAFVDTVNPPLLSTDHYPIMGGPSDTRAAYVENLLVLRRYALARGIPFWNFFQAMPFGSRGDVTETQMRWQATTTMALGGSGALYFCYWTPLGSDFSLGGALMTPVQPLAGAAAGNVSFVEGPHYAEARRINSLLRNFGDKLADCTSRVALLINSTDSPAQSLSSAGAQMLLNLTAGNAYIVGEFECQAAGLRRLVLMSHLLDGVAWPDVTLGGSAASYEEIDSISGLAAPLCDDSPNRPGLQLRLGPAMPRLLQRPL